MPELPEVETVRRSLERRIEGAVVSSVRVLFAGCLENQTPESFADHLRGRTIDAIGRRAKYLVFSLDDGSCFTVHLRMTGRLVVMMYEREAGAGPYTRLEWALTDGRRLRFDDQRKFGRVGWFPDKESVDRRIQVGPDPTGASFTPERLRQIVGRRRRPIKSLLLDQTLIGGLGNIYADESLFRAGIHPRRPAGDLSPAEVSALWLGIRAVLREGLKYKGTTLRDYVDGDGREGAYQERLRVYGKKGEACPECGAEIGRLKLGGRSSFYCPRCQREET